MGNEGIKNKFESLVTEAEYRTSTRTFAQRFICIMPSSFCFVDAIVSTANIITWTVINIKYMVTVLKYMD